MKRHNHEKLIERAIHLGLMAPPESLVTHVHVRHDGACPYRKGKRCKCSPDIRVADVGPDGVLENHRTIALEGQLVLPAGGG